MRTPISAITRRSIACLPDGRRREELQPLGGASSGSWAFESPGPWRALLETVADDVWGPDGVLRRVPVCRGEQIGKEPKGARLVEDTLCHTGFAPQMWFTASCRVDGWARFDNLGRIVCRHYDCSMRSLRYPRDTHRVVRKILDTLDRRKEPRS